MWSLFKVINKDTRTTSKFFIVDFEEVNTNQFWRDVEQLLKSIDIFKINWTSSIRDRNKIPTQEEEKKINTTVAKKK